MGNGGAEFVSERRGHVGRCVRLTWRETRPELSSAARTESAIDSPPLEGEARRRRMMLRTFIPLAAEAMGCGVDDIRTTYYLLLTHYLLLTTLLLTTYY